MKDFLVVGDEHMILFFILGFFSHPTVGQNDPFHLCAILFFRPVQK